MKGGITFWKEAQLWREMQNELAIILKTSKLPLKELCQRSGISMSHYSTIMKNTHRLKPKHFISLFRVIVESENYHRAKNLENDT